jgi:hypothetical protein
MAYSRVMRCMRCIAVLALPLLIFLTEALWCVESAAAHAPLLDPWMKQPSVEDVRCAIDEEFLTLELEHLTIDTHPEFTQALARMAHAHRPPAPPPPPASPPPPHRHSLPPPLPKRMHRVCNVTTSSQSSTAPHNPSHSHPLSLSDVFPSVSVTSGTVLVVDIDSPLLLTLYVNELSVLQLNVASPTTTSIAVNTLTALNANILSLSANQIFVRLLSFLSFRSLQLHIPWMTGLLPSLFAWSR